MIISHLLETKELSRFFKAQMSAFVGGITDYLIMLGGVELLGLHYITGIAIGGIIGALVNFMVNRRWSFRGKHQKLPGQLLRFTFVVFGSILLKSGGTSFFTEVLHIDYRISRIITDVIVSFGFNYILQRFWVFRKQMIQQHP